MNCVHQDAAALGEQAAGQGEQARARQDRAAGLAASAPPSSAPPICVGPRLSASARAQPSSTSRMRRSSSALTLSGTLARAAAFTPATISWCRAPASPCCATNSAHGCQRKGTKWPDCQPPGLCAVPPPGKFLANNNGWMVAGRAGRKRARSESWDTTTKLPGSVAVPSLPAHLGKAGGPRLSTPTPPAAALQGVSARHVRRFLPAAQDGRLAAAATGGWSRLGNAVKCLNVI